VDVVVTVGEKVNVGESVTVKVTEAVQITAVAVFVAAAGVFAASGPAAALFFLHPCRINSTAKTVIIITCILFISLSP
jgi:hypothetical protein